MHYPSETQITPLTTVRRERILPAPGDVLVRPGQRVEPLQVIATANLPGEFHILPVAYELRVAPSKVKKHLRVGLGDAVEKGQLVAKRIKSPISGVVTAIGGGRMLIESQPAVFELRAHLSGVVTGVMRDYGAAIETTGAVIQGAWGAGGESLGVVKCLTQKVSESLQADMIDPTCQGTILVGGGGLDAEVLKRAQELQARGIVAGSLAPELVPLVSKLTFPIVLTEGIGAIPMSAPAFSLLSTYDGREATISGEHQPRWGIVRPEIIIPLPAETAPSDEAQAGTALTIGTRVRVVRAPHMGAVGKVVKLPGYARCIDTGARVRGADVDLGQAAPAFIPLANLEILR